MHGNRFIWKNNNPKLYELTTNERPPPHTHHTHTPHTHTTHTKHPQHTATDLLRNILKTTNGRHFDNKLKYRIRDALPMNGHTIAKMVIETISLSKWTSHVWSWRAVSECVNKYSKYIYQPTFCIIWAKYTDTFFAYLV